MMMTGTRKRETMTGTTMSVSRALLVCLVIAAMLGGALGVGNKGNELSKALRSLESLLKRPLDMKEAGGPPSCCLQELSANAPCEGCLKAQHDEDSTKELEAQIRTDQLMIGDILKEIRHHVRDMLNNDGTTAQADNNNDDKGDKDDKS